MTAFLGRPTGPTHPTGPAGPAPSGPAGPGPSPTGPPPPTPSHAGHLPAGFDLPQRKPMPSFGEPDVPAEMCGMPTGELLVKVASVLRAQSGRSS